MFYISEPGLGKHHVRMAERSKAPDSSLTCAVPAYECSGLQLEAWVRIPLLTKFLIVKVKGYLDFLYSSLNCMKADLSDLAY